MAGAKMIIRHYVSVYCYIIRGMIHGSDHVAALWVAVVELLLTQCEKKLGRDKLMSCCSVIFGS